VKVDFIFVRAYSISAEDYSEWSNRYGSESTSHWRWWIFL